MNKIQIKNITKKYNNLTALDDVSFSFEFGKIYGLLGRNGAGKSTLINIIANRIFADEGMILVDDIPAKENMQVHEKVFCMSEADLYDKDLKIKEHFRWINRFYDCFDLNKALTIAKMFDLDINKKFRSLSKGYRYLFFFLFAAHDSLSFFFIAFSISPSFSSLRNLKFTPASVNAVKMLSCTALTVAQSGSSSCVLIPN